MNTFTTIQQTSRWIKVTRLIGWVLIISGVISFINSSIGMGAPLFVLGFVVTLFARISRWWVNS